MEISFKEIIGSSDEMKQVYSLIEQILDIDSTILILGESGTGKEMIAKAIHYYGNRKNKPFVTVNCGAIPDELLESELFGHEKGAFTGAVRARPGKFEMADTGTIFLDEIGDMKPNLQVKLLRALQEQEFDRIGGTKSVKVDIRIIAATNQNLEKAVAEKRFREDLFYRLNVIPINLPPLREREKDIPTLINYFIEKFNRTKKREIKGITKEATSVLLKYNWPGNVRELENIVERTVILKRKGTIDLDDIPEKISGKKRKNIHHSGFDENLVINESFSTGINLTAGIKLPLAGINLKKELEKFEDSLILQALEKSGGVKGKAAKLLGINRTTLVEKLKKKEIKNV